ncbi:hypothetical protein [Tropicimonas sp. IMCC34043]|uniref:hypothetical protein n=1 Tax=Tropicimonas sp. IMCC34043 TaxID=2248760 RepID=UPI001300B5C3|nr:hypothetical protein [Tropicimonas sp. IMCC34043]
MVAAASYAPAPMASRNRYETFKKINNLRDLEKICMYFRQLLTCHFFHHFVQSTVGQRKFGFGGGLSSEFSTEMVDRFSIEADANTLQPAKGINRDAKAKGAKA